jgi:signal transduction histidine kinase
MKSEKGLSSPIRRPRIFLGLLPESLLADAQKILEGLPCHNGPPPTGSEWSEGQIALIPEMSADSYVQQALNHPDADRILASAAVVGENSLSGDRRLFLYESGFGFVAKGPSPWEGLRARLESMLRLRARLLVRQEVNLRLEGRVEAMNALYQHQQDFLLMAVHDLRGPLAAMICYAELLMEGVLGNLQSSQLEPIRIIHRNCQLLIDMVNDLLDSAKIGAGKLMLKLEKAQFGREAEMALQSMKSLADTKGISLELEADPVPEMYLDIQKVGRVLTNLLGNAIKFTKTGGRIQVKIGQEGNFLVFSIQDTGPGIAAADLHSIFQKFNTGSGSNITGKGYGLGLAICKSFVELHGGRLYVESTRHKGSIFIVHLPVEKRKSAARRQQHRHVLIADLRGDIPGLEQLEGMESPGLHFEVRKTTLSEIRGDSASEKKLPSWDFLVVNESEAQSDLGADYFLLDLAEAVGNRGASLLVSKDLGSEAKEMRRHMGFQLIEKPCTPQALFDKLQEIAGLDRRQRNR